MSDQKRLERIEDKIDKLVEVQAEQGKTLAVNTQQLIDHIEGVRQTRELIALKEKEAAERHAPVAEHVAKIEGWINLGNIGFRLLVKIGIAVVLLMSGEKGASMLIEFLSKIQ